MITIMNVTQLIAKSDSIENKIVNNEKHKGLKTFKPK